MVPNSAHQKGYVAEPDDEYAAVAELIESKQPLCQPYLSTCAAKGCTLPVTIPPVAFRRDHFCPKHQIVFSVTKKLAHHGYGMPGPGKRLGAQPRVPLMVRSKSPGRASKKGIWKAAEEIWGKARAAGFNAPTPQQADAPITGGVMEQAA